MLCLSGFELYSRWVPLYTQNKARQNNYEHSSKTSELTATLDPLMPLKPRFHALSSSLNRVSTIYE